ncbi:MAG: hypothetical protein ACKOCQ_00420 [Candidatus Nitrosotenuis sp.]
MLDRIITGLFVGVLGTLWFFTRRCEIPHPYKIITYDALGKQTAWMALEPYSIRIQ